VRSQVREGGVTGLSVPDVTDLDALSAALAYAKAGWYVGPVKLGTKHPGSVLGKDWQQRTSRDPKVIIDWMALAGHGVFLHAGRSGAVIIDVDNVSAVADCPPLVAAIAAHIKAGHPVQSTGPGRGHYVFTQPPGRMLGNSKGKLTGAWGEIRGRNGVIIAAPTPHPEGRKYEWLATGLVPELPAALAELLPDAGEATDAATDAEVAAFLAAHTAHWQPHRLELTVADLEKRLTAGESRHETALVKTSLALKESARGMFSAADAVRRIGEVFTAAACRDLGDGRRTRDKNTARDEYAGIVAWAVGQVPPQPVAETASTEQWERPVPLGSNAALPAFPAEAFPLWLRAEVDGVAEFTQTPVDLPGTVALAVLATASGGRAVVEVRGAWREPVNLFAATALPPGSRKSAVFAAMTQPLLDTEQGLIERASPQIIEATTMRNVAQRDAEKRARQASGLDHGAERDRAMAEAVSAAEFAEAITIPVMPRLVADDITPEAAASLLAEQGGRLAVLSAEGGIFATIAGRYSGGVPSIEVFLKGHSGDMLRVDRKGRPPEHIPRPALTLGLCVQPEVLRAIADMPGFRGRGLLARILYSLPSNLVGRRKIGAPAVPDDVQAAYVANIRTLVMTMAEWTDPAVLTLTPEAAAVLMAAEEALEPRLAPDTGDLAGIVDWGSKLIGATARIAGLLHLAEHYADGWGKPISEHTMRNALRLADYFTVHALAAFDHMGVDPVLAAARELYAWIERTQPERFTKREMFSGVSRSRFPKVGDLDGPLDLIEQHGWIRREPEPERTGPGRPPSPAYLVHPDLTAETAISAQSPVSHGSADYAVSAARVNR
jgi:hypothetical protein